MKTLAVAALVTGLSVSLAAKADPIYTVTATAQLSQFDNVVTQTLTGSGDPVAVLPEASAQVASANTSAAASATSRTLSASISTADTGLNIPSATASTSGGGIVLDNSPALQSLFGPTGTLIQILLNFDVSYTATTDDIETTEAQATVNDHFSIFVSGSGLYEGSVSILNDSFGHTVNSFNLLAGLGEGSGSREISLPVNVSIYNPTITWAAEVDVGGLAVQDGFAVGSETLSLPDIGVLTTLDGTPLTNLGVQYAYVPPTLQDGDPTPVPEPASLALLAAGITSFGATAFGRRSRAV